MATAVILLTACSGAEKTNPVAADNFKYTVEQLAGLQISRYRISGFENSTLKQKELAYYLTQVALEGRDILFDQNEECNLTIRRALGTIHTDYADDRNSPDFVNPTTYLKRIWFSDGVHRHCGPEKFAPGFTSKFPRQVLLSVDASGLPLAQGQTVEQLFEELSSVVFGSKVVPKQVNWVDGEDLVLISASNHYDEVIQQEAEDFHNTMKDPKDETPVSYGLNSRLVRKNGKIIEKAWKVGGLYTQVIERIMYWLKKAEGVTEDEAQKTAIGKLIEYYETGDLRTFDEYAILWTKDLNSHIDLTNGFTETHGNPLGMRASRESIVNLKDLEATHRTELTSGNVQWFESHSSVDKQFKKEEVKGATTKVVTTTILGGDLYPATAIGINLPNSSWIRSHHGSKSVTIGNVTDAYNKAAHGNGFDEESVYSDTEKQLIDKYGGLTGELHTNLHEYLGHGSGRLLPGVDSDASKAYDSIIEEARADLFGLYYIADPKLLESGLMPAEEAYRTEHYIYLTNGLVTQLVHIKPSNSVEEACVCNRQLITRWVFEEGKADRVVGMIQKDGKTYVVASGYQKLRHPFDELLAEIQRIKPIKDFATARLLVKTYAVKVDPELHSEVLVRYKRLNLASYRGFVNPRYDAVTDEEGNITDVKVTYDEGYAEQMLRYSRGYSPLPSVND